MDLVLFMNHLQLSVSLLLSPSFIYLYPHYQDLLCD